MSSFTYYIKDICSTLRNIEGVIYSIIFNIFLKYNFSYNFTLYLAYSREGRGNLVSKHCVHHFTTNFRDIACLVPKLNSTLCLFTKTRKFICRVELELRTLMLTLTRCATTTSRIEEIFVFKG